MSDMAALFSIIGVVLAAFAMLAAFGAWALSNLEKRMDQRFDAMEQRFGALEWENDHRFSAIEGDLMLIKAHLIPAASAS